MKKGQKMTKAQVAAHTKRMRAAWRRRKSNGSSDYSETVRSRVREVVAKEIDRALNEMLSEA